MSFTIVNAAQRSPEWFQARAGLLTGSRAADAFGTIKTGEAAAKRDYRLQLAIERLTGMAIEDGYTTRDMQRGIDLEPAARAAYEARTGRIVRCTGFLKHSDWPAGCSLDGDVGEFQGLIEIKCPKSATHVGYLRQGVLPKEYEYQCRHALWITGAKWLDFVSYDDRLPRELQLFIVRMTASEAKLAEYQQLALAFLGSVHIELEGLKRLAAGERPQPSELLAAGAAA